MAKKRDLRGRVVLLTGATGGLGQALARRFAECGAKLGLLDLHEAALDQLATELRARGAPCHLGVCDVCDRCACDRAIAQVSATFGGIDLLVNNAGITQRSAFAETDIDVFRRVMEVNFFGSLHCTKAALPHLLARRGQIVVISSVAGFAPLVGRSGYSASKHALHGLFASVRAELRETGVRVLIVAPAFIQTNIDINALDGGGEMSQHPQSTVGRVMSAERAARAIVRAAQDDRQFLPLGKVAVATRILVALWPGLYERLMRRSLGAEIRRHPDESSTGPRPAP